MTRPVSIIFFSAFGILLLSVMAPLFAAILEQTPELPKFYPAPSFSLINTQDENFDSSQLTGKVWIANFFFSRCQGPCPIQSANIARLYQSYSNSKNLNFVSITVDPDNDTPEVLAEYRRRFVENSDRWHFLTGPEESIVSLLNAGFRLGSLEEPKFHSTRFVLVDQTGTIRGFYQGTEKESVALLEQDIKALLKQ